MTITNGTVEYTTPRPFDAASARVVLSFDFAVGEDVEVLITSVGELARRRAIALISAPVSNLEKAKAPVDQVMTGGPVAPPAVVLGPVPNGTVWAGPAAGKPVGNVVDIMGGSVAPNPTATAALPAAAAAQPEAPAPVSDQRLR